MRPGLVKNVRPVAEAVVAAVAAVAVAATATGGKTFL